MGVKNLDISVDLRQARRVCVPAYVQVISVGTMVWCPPQVMRQHTEGCAGWRFHP